MAAHVAWDIYLNGKRIDTVYYDPDCDEDYVRRGLINHDGYDPGITVKKARARPKPKPIVQVEYSCPTCQRLAFGEPGGAVCRVCGVPMLTEASKHAQDVFQKSTNAPTIILRTVFDLGGLYGRTTVARILDGSVSKKILTITPSKLRMYGKLSGMSAKDILSLLDWLIAESYIAYVEGSGGFPALVITAKGLGILSETVPPTTTSRVAEGKYDLTIDVLALDTQIHDLLSSNIPENSKTGLHELLGAIYDQAVRMAERGGK